RCWGKTAAAPRWRTSAENCVNCVPCIRLPMPALHGAVARRYSMPSRGGPSMTPAAPSCTAALSRTGESIARDTPALHPTHHARLGPACAELAEPALWSLSSLLGPCWIFVEAAARCRESGVSQHTAVGP